MRKQKGFSLIELLIVVAIILIIAAIAIPNLLRSRIAANEASAVGSLRTLNTAEITYASTYPNIGFVPLANLGGTVGGTATYTAALLIDPVLANGTKSGYAFAPATTAPPAPVLTATSAATTYDFEATPSTPGQTGQRNFYTDMSGVIRYTINQTSATSASSALQ